MTTLDTKTETDAPRQRDPWWRTAFVAAGVLMLVGGPMHPDSPAELGLREELAMMMDDDAWIPGHSLLLAATILLAVGLWRVQQQGVWPTRVRTALSVAVVAFALYVIEAFFHLIAFVDVDRLRDGDVAPVAFTHIGLATVLYPASGLALVYLSSQLLRSWPLPSRAVAVVGIVGGLLHAVSVPATLILPDAELSPVFAFAGVTMALWSIGAGLVGIRSAVVAPALEPQPVA